MTRYVVTSALDSLQSLSWRHTMLLFFIMLLASGFTLAYVPQNPQRQCSQMFPKAFPTPPTPKARATNAKFKGWNVNLDRLFFANGKRVSHLLCLIIFSSLTRSVVIGNTCSQKTHGAKRPSPVISTPVSLPLHNPSSLETDSTAPI